MCSRKVSLTRTRTPAVMNPVTYSAENVIREDSIYGMKQIEEKRQKRKLKNLR